jgi:hypothetical protein
LTLNAGGADATNGPLNAVLKLSVDAMIVVAQCSGATHVHTNVAEPTGGEEIVD